MNLNSLIYPAPTPSIEFSTDIENLLLVDSVQPNSKKQPKTRACYGTMDFEKTEKSFQIPCLFINKEQWDDQPEESKTNSFQIGSGSGVNGSQRRIMLYFHGNAEDVGHNFMFLYRLNEIYNCSVLAMEYPGYGFFTNEIKNNQQNLDKKLYPSAHGIGSNAISVYNHLIRPFEEGGLGYQEKEIIIFGRSMGSGPATLLASMFKPRALILMSAYTSIKHVAQNVAGNFLGYFVANHFNNLEKIKSVNCPTILIHGRADPLIPSEHSQSLFDEIQKNTDSSASEVPFTAFCEILLHEHMTHNDFNMDQDILFPIKEFLMNINDYYGAEARPLGPQYKSISKKQYDNPYEKRGVDF